MKQMESFRDLRKQIILKREIKYLKLSIVKMVKPMIDKVNKHKISK